ncbi:hypothetical protein EW026_g3903 [Hermanssonia centrifuga]|uniref:Uncharacterized protein n=1 Tax=Hermanssonia centrifuga TaxID=98765 RepID=A0A4S4KIS4_9APHY|nr:hypothetical protein EW026_g3903 [Hermanssonia centrifuga]
MSGKGNHGYGSNGYTVSSSGTNSQVISLPGFPLGKQFTDRRITPNTSQGNHYCHRDSDSGSSGYHYSNSNGSYYYSNPNGSTYYNNGSGSSQYTAPDGNVYNK